MIAERNDTDEVFKLGSSSAGPKPPPLPPHIETTTANPCAPAKRTIGLLLVLAEVVQLELLLWSWANLNSVYRWKEWEHFGHVVGLTFGAVGIFWIAVLIFLAFFFVLLTTAAAAVSLAILIHLLTSNHKRKTYAALLACAGFPAGTVVGLNALYTLVFFSNRSQSQPAMEQRA